MRDLSVRLKTIQAAAGAQPTEQTALDLTATAPAVAPDPVEPKGVDWPLDIQSVLPRSEIITALQKGATSYALALSLQALADLIHDPGFAAEAVPLAKPTKTGEEWKRAYKTYERYAPKLIDAGQRNDNDAACNLFACAFQEVSEIYCVINPGDPMTEQLALAVYEALSRCYDEHRQQIA